MSGKEPDTAAVAAAAAALYICGDTKSKNMITSLRKTKSKREGISLWKLTGLIDLMRRSEFFEK